jgi:SsrA-binding protein
MASSRKQTARGGADTVATNRKARRDYQVLEKYEAGIELRGTEVKSLRDGKVSIAESYARIEDGEVFLHQLHIMPYEYGNVHNHDPVRVRRLLLHKHEIKTLFGKTAVKGNALIPLRIYFKRGKAKVELALCRGKQQQDKRETIKRKTAQREAERTMAAHKRR